MKSGSKTIFSPFRLRISSCLFAGRVDAQAKQPNGHSSLQKSREPGLISIAVPTPQYRQTPIVSAGRKVDSWARNNDAVDRS